MSIKNALKLKEINPEMDIYILFRDIRTYGFIEDYYREASDKDVKFIRYEPDDKPQVEAVEEEGRPVLRVTVTGLYFRSEACYRCRLPCFGCCRYSPRRKQGNISIIQGLFGTG